MQFTVPAGAFVSEAELAVDKQAAYIVPRYVEGNIAEDGQCKGRRTQSHQQFFLAPLQFDGAKVTQREDLTLKTHVNDKLTKDIVDLRQTNLAPLWIVGNYSDGKRVWEANLSTGWIDKNFRPNDPNYHPISWDDFITRADHDFIIAGEAIGQVRLNLAQQGRDPKLLRELVDDASATGIGIIRHHQQGNNNSLISIGYNVAPGQGRSKTLLLENFDLIQLSYTDTNMFAVGLFRDVALANPLVQKEILLVDLITGHRTKVDLNYMDIVSSDSNATVKTRYSRFRSGDLSRLYWDEYYLHAPLAIAAHLNENKRFEEAMRWLSLAYDPIKQTEEERRVFPGFAQDQLDALSINSIGVWLSDPFNPYALAELNRISYFIKAKLAHVENLLDWADRLFTLDTAESVNRARAHYEPRAKFWACITGLRMNASWSNSTCDSLYGSWRRRYLSEQKTDCALQTKLLHCIKLPARKHFVQPGRRFSRVDARRSWPQIFNASKIQPAQKSLSAQYSIEK